MAPVLGISNSNCLSPHTPK